MRRNSNATLRPGLDHLLQRAGLTSADANPDSYLIWTAGPSSTSGWPMEASQIRPSAFHPPRRDSLKRTSVSAPKADGAEPKAEAETTGLWSISRRRPFCETSALILSYADPAEWLSPSIRLQYADDADDADDLFREYKSPEGAPVEFRIPEGTSIAVVNLPTAVEARYFRLVIHDYSVASCLRMEMMGCSRSECLDVDECARGKNGDCQQKCVNNPVPVQQLTPTNGQNISLTCNQPGRPLARTRTVSFRQFVYDPRPGFPQFWFSEAQTSCPRIDCGKPAETPGAEHGFFPDTCYKSSFFFGC